MQMHRRVTRLKSTSSSMALIACGLMLFSGQVATSQTCPQSPLRLMLNPDNNVLANLENTPVNIGEINGVSIPTSTFLVTRYFEYRSSILFTTNNGENPVPSGWDSEAAMKFKSYATFDSEVGDTSYINSNIAMVLYDNEEWNGCGASGNPTPKDEQEDPLAYTKDFFNTAHSNNLHFMATPSRDLASCQKDYSGTLDDFYLAEAGDACSGGVPCGDDYNGDADRPFPTWAAASAGSANVWFEMQSQVHSADGNYYSFTNSAATEAVNANANVKLYAGLSTTYADTTTFNGSQMYDNVSSTCGIKNMEGYYITMSNDTNGWQEIVNFMYRLYANGI